MHRFALAVVAGVLLAPAAHASLVGSTISISNTGGHTQLDSGLSESTCTDIMVGAGVECIVSDAPTNFSQFPNALIEIDVMDSSLLFSFLDAGSSGDSFAWGLNPRAFDVVLDGLTWVDHPTSRSRASRPASRRSRFLVF
ncbi:hypothetical protein DKT77_13235 [Meridianimarinicoccus roseus]|uniref:Uncharacterized protein n=1 Tax=Meridianimarinicoccus roseus TaxID=2072018 RepID=A0A2V2L9W2_9RHOB|nr:hypothetical protein [Meridianimarinicoccus roseus]PWR02220.1 hypothetical protein DKT77_13235 [Meridianimarinicoccus roseus]